MRGVLDLEVEIQGGDRDLHSGVNGGLLPAAWQPMILVLSAMCWPSAKTFWQEPTFDLMALISSLTDSAGLPTVAGFSDREGLGGLM